MTNSEAQKITSNISVMLSEIFNDRANSEDVTNVSVWAIKNIINENKKIKEYLEIEYEDDLYRFLDN
jgi:hypothetical protein